MIKSFQPVRVKDLPLAEILYHVQNRVRIEYLIKYFVESIYNVILSAESASDTVPSRPPHLDQNKTLKRGKLFEHFHVNGMFDQQQFRMFNGCCIPESAIH